MNGYGNGGGICVYQGGTFYTVNSIITGNLGNSAYYGWVESFEDIYIYSSNASGKGINTIVGLDSVGWASGSSIIDVSYGSLFGANDLTDMGGPTKVVPFSGSPSVAVGQGYWITEYVADDGTVNGVGYASTKGGSVTMLWGNQTGSAILISEDQRGYQRANPTSIGAYDPNAQGGETPSLIVTTTRDVVDSTDGYTSLREAMNYAASLNGSQTISFNITDPAYAHGSADYLVIESALPTINKSLAVKGTNVATGNDVTISVANRGCFTDGTVNESGSEFRIFTIKNGDVTLSHLNLIGGRIDQLTGNERYGAAVFGDGSSCNITIDHVNASGGAARTGGALAFTNVNSVKIYDSVFEENRAAWGGAVYLETASALISDSVFRNNNRIIDSGFSDGYYNGGALCAGANSTFSVSNSTFYNNTGSRGGALYVENSASGSVKNSLFYGNQAVNSSVQNPTGVGGAIWQSQATTLETSTLSIVNCTIAENSAVNYAGGVHIKIGSITNSILWGNTASDQAQVVYDASVPITYSAIEGWSAGGSGNIALQSENSGTDIFDKHYANFVDPTRGDYHLAPTSYLMDRGNNSVVSAGEKDLDGNERIQYNMVDLGAYEKTPDETFSLIVTTGDDIVSVYDGKTSLREALAYAATLGGTPEITFDIVGNDTVILNSALDTIDFSLTIDGYNQATGNDVTISVESPGVILNTEGEWIDNPSGSAFRVFTIYTGNTVLENPITVSLHNMKLHGGYLPNYTSGVDPSLTTYGGAVYVNGKYLNFLAENVTFAQGSTYAGGGLYLRANSTLENCIFEHNRSIHGGGVHIEVSTVEVKNSFFQENNITASPYDDYRDHYYEGSYGGAISIAWDGIVAITQSRFENNQATRGGAVFHETSSILTISNSIFENNTAFQTGGAIGVYNWWPDETSGNLVCINSLFYGNQATGTEIYKADIAGRGGAIFFAGVNVELTNCTIAGNEAATAGGGADLVQGTVKNSVFWGNYAPVNAQLNITPSVTTIVNSAIEGWTGGGVGNISLQSENNGTDAPGEYYANFVDPASGDYRLDANSYLINRGDNSAISFEMVDLAGNSRLQYGYVDIGAYETVGKGNIVIDFTAPETLIYGDSASISASHDGRDSGTIAYESANTEAVLVAGTTITAVKASESSVLSATVAESTNWNSASATRTVTTQKRSITVTADAHSKVYGEADPELTYQVNGLVGEDTLSGSLEREAGEDVGEYAITLGTLANSNYNINFTGATFTVTAKDITVTADAVTQVYGDLEQALTYEVNGLVADDTLGGTLERVAGKTVGEYAITQGTLGNSNYNIHFTGAVYTITKRDLTITAGDILGHTYGTAYTLSYTSSTLGIGDSFTGNLAIDPKDAHKSQSGNYAVGDHVITIGSLDIIDENDVDMSDNYSIHFNEGTLNIIPAEIEVATVEVADKIYDGTTSATLESWSFNNPVANADALQLSGTALFATKHAGEGKLASVKDFVLTGADAGNYILRSDVELTTTAMIGKASLSIVLDDAAKGYGSVDPGFTVKTAAGLQTGDQITGIGRSDKGEDVGKYAIDQYSIDDGNGGNNYTVESFSAGTLTISSKVLTITIDNVEFTYNGAEQFATSYTANGLEAGDEVTSLTVEGVKDAGIYSIAATAVEIRNNGQDVTGNYTVSFIRNTDNVTVKAADVTVTAADSVVTYGEDYSLEHDGVLFGNDAFTGELAVMDGSSSSSGKLNAGIYTIIQGTLDAGKNYNLIFHTGVLTVNKAELSVESMSAADRSYDGSDVATMTGYTYAGLLNGDQVTLSGTGRFADRHAGTDKTVTFEDLAISGVDSGNYRLTKDDFMTTADISKASIGIRANDAGKGYGSSDPVLSYTVLSGKLYGTDAIDINREAGENVGTYAIDRYEVNDGNGGGNYEVIFTPGNFTIGAKSAVISVGTTTVGYNGEVQTATEYTIDGLESGHSVYQINLGGARNAGTYAVTVESIQIHDADGNDVTANYGLSYHAGTLEIQQAEISIHATTETITYGEQANAGYTYSGTLYGNDGFTGTLSIAGAMNSQNTLYAAGTARFERGTLEIADGNNGDNYHITFVGADLTVEAKEISLSAVEIQDKVYDGTTDAAVLTAMVAGMEAGDSLSVVTDSASASFVSKNVGTDIEVNADGFVLAGADRNNYILKSDSFKTTADIAKANLTIYTQNTSKIYGDNDPEFTFSADGLKMGDSITGLGRSNTGTNVGSYDIDLYILNDGNNGNNYNVTLHTGKLTIIPKDITVIADTQTKVYGEADPKLTYQVSGLVGNDTLSGSLERVAGEDVGEYAILQGTLTNSNYNLSFTGATFTITAKEITIDPADPNFHYAIDSKVYDGNTTVTGAELSVVIGGETVVLNWTDGQFNSKDVVSVTDATFSGLTSANSNYVLATDTVTVGAAGKITAKDITVTADAQTKIYGEADPELTYQVSGLVGDDTLTGSLERVAGEDVGEYAITQGTLANSNYNLSFTGATFTITAKEIVIDPNDSNFLYAIDSKVYDGNTTVTGAELSVVIGGETVVLNWTDGQFNSKDVVSVTDATFSGLTSANTNYVLAVDHVTVDASEKILAKDITVTADAQTKIYGEADPELTYQVSGMLKGDTLAGSLERVAGEDVGEYAILQGTLTNSNYNLSFTGATFTITAKEITIDPADPNFHYAIDSKVYDGNTTVTGAELSVVIGGETVVLNWTDGQFNSKDVVSVTDATFSGLTSANTNYVLAVDHVTVDASEKILAKDITVTADAQTKIYGEADPELTYQVNGLVGDDTLTGSLVRVAGEDVGEYAITQGTLSNSNYNINFTGATFTITAKEIVIDSNDSNFLYAIDSKVYDGNTTVTGAELSVVIGGETVVLNWTDGQFNSKDVVSVTDATFSGLTSANGNYILATDTVTVGAAGKILSKDVTVTADTQTKVYGEADPELTYQVSGLVGNDTLTGSLQREVGEDVGEYAITQGTLSNSNYDISFTGAVLSITERTDGSTASSGLNFHQYSEALNPNYSALQPALVSRSLADAEVSFKLNENVYTMNHSTLNADLELQNGPHWNISNEVTAGEAVSPINHSMMTPVTLTPQYSDLVFSQTAVTEPQHLVEGSELNFRYLSSELQQNLNAPGAGDQSRWHFQPEPVKLPRAFFEGAALDADRQLPAAYRLDGLQVELPHKLNAFKCDLELLLEELLMA